MRDGERQDQRLVVVAAEPARTADVIRERLISVLPPREHPPMSTWESRQSAGIVVCDASQASEACDQLARLRPGGGDSTGNAVPVLVERGLTVAGLPNGLLVAPRRRSQAVFFQDAFHLFHTLPWSERSRLPLPLADCKARLAVSLAGPTTQPARAERAATVELIAQRFAVNVMSVFDWITGSPSFAVEPLSLVTALAPPLAEASPFVGILKKQHRMHSSISRVPWALFYFNEALEDVQSKPGHYVQLIQVAGSNAEDSADKVDEIYRRLQKMNPKGVLAELPRIMVITPYRDCRFSRVWDRRFLTSFPPFATG